MLITKLKRVTKAGFVSFWRNGFISFASILVMSITLFVIGSIVFMGTIFNHTLDQIKDKVDINVYFITSAGTQDIMAIKRILKPYPKFLKLPTLREKML